MNKPGSIFTAIKGIDRLADWIQRIGDRYFMTNEWLYADDMEVYVRKSKRSCGVCLDIANITVYDTGQGIFTSFLEQVHAMNPWEVTYVESVQSIRLREFLLRKEFVVDPHSGGHSYYLLKK